LFGLAQPLLDQLDIPVRCLPSALRLLLEDVKYIHRPSIFQGVYRPESVATVVFDDFQDARSTKAAKNLCVLMLAAALRDVQGISHVILHWRRELSKIFQTRANRDYRLERRVIGHGSLIIVISLYRVNRKD